MLQDSEGQCDCTASHHQECPNAQGASAQRQGDSGDVWLPPPMAGGSLATDSLTLEMQVLSFFESAGFAWD